MPDSTDPVAAVYAALEAAADGLRHAPALEAVLLTSTWATGEITRVGSGAAARILSDVDLHLVTRGPAPALRAALRDTLCRRLPGIEIDIHAITLSRLRRARPTLESVTTRLVGRVLAGRADVLDVLPHPEAVPPAEYLRLLANRTAELLAAVLEREADPVVLASRCAKALADTAPALLFPRYLPTYAARLAALRPRAESEEAARLAVRGLEAKLDGNRLLAPSPPAYAEARAALLAARARLAELHDIRLPLDSALRGWARLWLNPALPARARCPASAAALRHDPRSALYALLFDLLTRLDAPAALEGPPPDGWVRRFPVRRRRAAPGTLGGVLAYALGFYAAEVQGTKGWEP